jgi:hypothetical protein
MATQLPLLDLRVEAAPFPVRGASVGVQSRRPHHRRGSLAAPATTAGAHTPAARPARDSVHWRLDDRTREVGLQGVAEARKALAAAVRRSSPAA